MGLISKIFGSSNNEATEMLNKGAVIVDVRTEAEYAGGHAENSKNIPLHTFEKKIPEIKEWNKPVVLCCASGMRSGKATNQLRKEGVECCNAGSWKSLA